MRAPASRNLNLLRKYVNHFKDLAPSNNGSFKNVWIDHSGRLPLVLKKCKNLEGSGDWEEWDANDLMLEICAQHSNEDLAEAIVPYVAWGRIDGEFWALQPEVEYRDGLYYAMEEGAIYEFGEALDILIAMKTTIQEYIKAELSPMIGALPASRAASIRRW